VKNHMQAPEKREAQKLLAYKVVEIIHWEKEAKLAKQISEFMFGDPEKRVDTLKNLDETELETFQNAMWGLKYSWENLFETIVKSGLEKSNSNARNSIKSWAIFINEKKVEDFNLDLEKEFLENSSLLLRKGKKNFRIIKK
jgi:tyrosyl-tRNA synthetase